MEQMRTFARETRLRQEPSGKAEQLAVIPPKTEVLVLGQEGNFCRVSVTDKEGGVLEGYIASGFLQPLPAPGEATAETVVEPQRHTISKPAFSFPWPRFDRTTGWLALGLAALLVLNLVTAIVLGRGIRDLQGRSYHVTCSGSHVPQTYTWGRYQEYGWIDPEYYQDGQVRAVFQYQVLEKLPGSRIILHHRLDGEEAWQDTVMQESSDEALLYVASLYLEPSAIAECQVLQRLNGENVRAEASRRLNVSSQMGNDLYFRQHIWQGRIELRFSYQRAQLIAALQAAEIVVRIDQKNPVELRLLPDINHEFSASAPIEGFKTMSITVRYQDGEEQTLELEHLPVESMVIRR